MATKKSEDKKTTTTKPKTRAKKKVEEPKMQAPQFDMSQVTPEVMAQMFAMFQQFNQTQPTETQVKVEQPKKTKFKKSDLIDIEDEKIIVTSVVNNVWWRSPRTNVTYKWAEKGDYEHLKIRDVLDMKKDFLTIPMLKIEDVRVIQALGLETLYEKIEKVEDFEELKEMSTVDMERLFKELPMDFKKNFANEIYVKIKNNELSDFHLIKTFEEVLGTVLTGELLE